MIKLSGKGLMSGQNSTLTVNVEKDGGIRFLNNGTTIPALANNVISTSNFVVLGNQTTQFCLIEHLMASLAICNIKNALIELDGKEVPILDGSAKGWVEAFKKAGVANTSEIEVTEFKQPITYTDGDTEIVLIPSDSFKITYLVNFNHKDLQNRWVTFDAKQDPKEIYEARTFGYLNDLEKFHAMGIALGADLDNTVGLKDDGTYTCELRSEFESAKHKILDIIGDLHLTGRNPLGFKAHVIAKLAGHKSHVEFAKKIMEEL